MCLSKVYNKIFFFFNKRNITYFKINKQIEVLQWVFSGSTVALQWVYSGSTMETNRRLIEY
ncbi:hypothetical protein HMPREF9078_00137 [Capnocytophaga sp. oral taxon 380 str. F0488]|nr:hypothetical protein HMPREF9078_00137 [Capnocytophaga sp. oral taxon 380 str. F0488]